MHSWYWEIALSSSATKPKKTNRFNIDAYTILRIPFFSLLNCIFFTFCSNFCRCYSISFYGIFCLPLSFFLHHHRRRRRCCFFGWWIYLFRSEYRSINGLKCCHTTTALIVLHVKELLFKTKNETKCISQKDTLNRKKQMKKKREGERDTHRKNSTAFKRTRNENQINALECVHWVWVSAFEYRLHDFDDMLVFGIQIKRL